MDARKTEMPSGLNEKLKVPKLGYTANTRIYKLQLNSTDSQHTRFIWNLFVISKTKNVNIKLIV